MTPGREAFLQLVGVLLATGVLRAGCAPRVPPEDGLPGVAVDPSALEDSARILAADAERRTRPLAAGERLDPNRASEAELDRLPGVGPGLARAIVAARDSAPFRSVSDLIRVRGVGSSTLEKLRPGLEIRGRPPGRATVPRPARSPAEGRRPPVVIRAQSGTATAGPTSPRRSGPLNLNRATAPELESLPGIGPVLAERIVAERRRRGHFSSVDDLIAVKGIGPALLERLEDRVHAGSWR